MSNNILTLLKEDHQKVATILEKLADTTEAAMKTREKQFAELKKEISLHKKFEEEVFYPRIKNEAENTETEDLVDESYEEHHIVDNLIVEMEELPCTDEMWTAKLTVLKENIEHHVEEEEKDLFPRTKKILNNDDLEEMGAKLLEWKKNNKNGVPIPTM